MRDLARDRARPQVVGLVSGHRAQTAGDRLPGEPTKLNDVKQHIKRPVRAVLLAFMVLMALVLAWGYWYAWNHADLWVRVDDYALTSSGGPSVPHDVTLAFRDNTRAPLAVARSVDLKGFILAVHPSAEIGNCQHAALLPPAGNASPGDYARCHEQYAAWSAKWALRVHSADLRVGSCELRDVPVTVSVSNTDWLIWWVPLPHVGGIPLQHVELSVAINSRACAAVRP